MAFRWKDYYRRFTLTNFGLMIVKLQPCYETNENGLRYAVYARERVCVRVYVYAMRVYVCAKRLETHTEVYLYMLTTFEAPVSAPAEMIAATSETTRHGHCYYHY